VKVDGKYEVTFKGITEGVFLAIARASVGSYYTYYEFTLISECIQNCETCSETSMCNVCDDEYILDYSQQCVEDEDAIVDSSIIAGAAAAVMLSILAIGSMQMQISPNLWVMVNTLQILRTILLLKIKLPLGIRQVIQESSMFAALDFGLASGVTGGASSNESILKIMDGDGVLTQYFQDYGIDTYRFIDYVISTLLDVILLFLLLTFLMSALSYLYLRFCKKKDTTVIKDKIKYIFVANGLIRIYMEILLDGILYVFVNLRNLKFLSFLDAFSFMFLLAFAVFVIFFSVFFVVYTRGTEISKWNGKILELLSETNRTNKGVLVYHLVFILRRIVIAINVIMLGTFNPNIHISIHVVCQLVSLGFILFYPMFESRFQKVSNLIMEVSISIIFLCAYIFQNVDSTSMLEVFVIFMIFFSQFLIMLLTVIKGIKDFLSKYKDNLNDKITINKFELENVKEIGINVVQNTEQPFDAYHKDKSPLGTIDDDLEFAERWTSKMALEEVKDGSRVIPMRRISDFEQMGGNSNLNSQSQSVNHKDLKEIEPKMEEKKSRLNKLLHKTKKKKKFLKKKSFKKQEIVTHDMAKKPSSPNDDIHMASNKTNDSTPQYNQELNDNEPEHKLKF
jgi:hypothetical protein